MDFNNPILNSDFVFRQKCITLVNMMNTFALPQEWYTAPAEFSLAPFWFWNDDLDEKELARQMDEFQAHAIDAFVIHPRVGLPRNMGWMSTALLEKIRFAIHEAQKRGMWVILYDEGMYPSGSSSGQVVAENPAYQCRGLIRINLDTIQANTIEQGIKIAADGKLILDEYQTLIAEVPYNGHRYAIVQRPVNAVIRGLHFADHNSQEQDPPEDEPLAIDLLNPDAVRSFIRLVYQRYYDEFGDYFGNVIQAIFTDEPMLLGRPKETGIMPGTVDSLQDVNDYLGYDFTPYLPALWDDDAPQNIRDDYERALEHRFEQSYYAQLYDWCEAHNISLTGHPAEPDATRHLRYFHIPGQDIVWRFIEPDKASALEGRQSTQAKAASSMMLHTKRRRNANEFCGAYGHELSFEEMCWLANWLIVRGCNLLIPHAFYYSVRGARYHERPPDVGLHSSWWNERFTKFAEASRRLCWLNTDSQHICHVAILGEHHHLPYRAAKDCFEHQIDFNYLDIEDLARCIVTEDNRLQIASQSYQVLIVDTAIPESIMTELNTLSQNIAIVYWSDDVETHIAELQSILPDNPFSQLEASGLRVRHVKKAGCSWYILFNETSKAIERSVKLENSQICDPQNMLIEPFSGRLELNGHELKILMQKED